MLKMILIVGLGGFFGTVVRFGSVKFIAQFTNISFPYGTLFVNIIGSFIIGILFALSSKTTIMSSEMRLLLTTGFCGGFTTFSTFALDCVHLINDEQYFAVASYLLISIIVGILAVFLGIWIIKII